MTEKVALAVQILKNQNAFKKREEKLGEGPHLTRGAVGPTNFNSCPFLPRTSHTSSQVQLPPELRGGIDASLPFLNQDQGVPNSILPSCHSHSHSHPPQFPQNVNQEKLTEINISQEQRKKGAEGEESPAPGGCQGSKVGADKVPLPTTLLGKGGIPCSSRTWGVMGITPRVSRRPATEKMAISVKAPASPRSPSARA